jgi:glutathione S-transferase
VLTLYYRPTCPYSLRVRLVLAEKLLPFSRRVVVEGDPPPELNELSGGKVPVITDGSFAVSDSTVICEYLEDAFTRPALRPPDARGRAVIRGAIKRIDTELMGPVEEFADKGHDQVERAVIAQIHDALSAWEHTHRDNGLLFGMEFSLADAWLIAALEKALLSGWELPSDFSKLNKWHARMRERASVRTERLMPPA